MKTLSIFIAVFAVLVGVSCSDSETGPITDAQSAQKDAQRLISIPSIPDFQGYQMIFYRGSVLDVDLERISKADATLAASSGKPIVKMFYTVELPETHPYKLVMDAVVNRRSAQYTVLQVIQFKEYARPRQFTSVAEIENAINAREITVSNTELFYRGSFHDIYLQ